MSVVATSVPSRGPARPRALEARGRTTGRFVIAKRRRERHFGPLYDGHSLPTVETDRNPGSSRIPEMRTRQRVLTRSALSSPLGVVCIESPPQFVVPDSFEVALLNFPGHLLPIH